MSADDVIESSKQNIGVLRRNASEAGSSNWNSKKIVSPYLSPSRARCDTVILAAATPPHTTSQQATRAEEERWFAEEVLPHGSQLKAYLHSSYPSVGDLEDFVQESYLRIWKAKARQPIRSAKAFLFQIARHLALDFVRRERSSPINRVSDLAALSVIDSRPGVVETVSRNEKIRLLANAIDTLPGRCREIFILRRLKCIPQEHVAARFGLSERTVETQVWRGLKRCEEYLRERGVRGLFGDEIS